LDRSSVAKSCRTCFASRGAFGTQCFPKLFEDADAQCSTTFPRGQTVRATSLFRVEQRLLSTHARIAEPSPQLAEMLSRPTTILDTLRVGLLPCVHGDIRTCVRLRRALAATRPLLDNFDDLVFLDDFLGHWRTMLDAEVDEQLDRVAKILGLLVREHDEVDAELEFEPVRRKCAHIDRSVLPALELNEPRDGTGKAVVVVLSISRHDDDPLRRFAPTSKHKTNNAMRRSQTAIRSA
jgi:hypothetical protein